MNKTMNGTNYIQLEMEFDFKNVSNKEIFSRKEMFLKKLKSKNGYKRYLGTPLRYAGGFCIKLSVN